MKGTIRIISIMIAIMFLILGMTNENCNMMLLAVLILFFTMIIYAYKQKEKGLILFIFLIAFFTFLLGRYTLRLITGEDWTKDFSTEVNLHIQLCLFLSLIGIYAGFYFSNKRIEKIEESNKVKKYDIEKDNSVKVIRETAKILYYCTWIFRIIVVINKIIFVQQNSYLAVYTEYSSNMPLIITKLSEVNTFLMYIFLATLPSKKEIKMPLMFFTFTEVITILSGGRTKSVTAILFIAAYLCYREFKNRRENEIKYEWVKKRNVRVAILIIPVVIAFLSAYNLIRNNVKIENFSITNEIKQFFEDQGGSVKLIGYVNEYKEQLPATNSTYFFGPVISFFRNGVIGKIFFNTPIYKGNSLENALYGNNLGSTLSYIVLKNMYFEGVGLGTQYIAETYADLGYFGVIVFNAFLGWLITKINFRANLKWYWGAILFSIIRLIIYIPRDFALTWLSAFFSILNWGTIIFVIIFSRFVKLKEE